MSKKPKERPVPPLRIIESLTEHNANLVFFINEVRVIATLLERVGDRDAIKGLAADLKNAVTKIQNATWPNEEET